MDGQKIMKRAKETKDALLSKIKALPFLSNIANATSLDPAARFIKAILYCALSFLLGASSMAFGSYPSGMALLCASSEYSVFILIGNVAAAIAKAREYRLGYVIVLCAIFLLRLFAPQLPTLIGSSKGKQKERQNAPFDESFILRSAIAALGALGVSLARIISAGLSFYALGALIFSVTVSPVFCFILCGASKKDAPIALHRDAASILLCFLCVYAIREYSVFGFSLSLTACTFAVLFFARRHDILRSTFCALVCGLSCSPLDSAMFALITFAYSLVRKYYKKLALPVSLLCAFGYSLTFSGAAALGGTIPDVICGALLFCAFEELIISPTFSPDNAKIKAFESDSAKDPSSAARENIGAKGHSEGERNEKITRSLDELSGILTRLSAALRHPTYDDVAGICRDVCSRHCALCSRSGECYCEGGGGDDMIPTLTAAAIRNSKVVVDDVALVGIENIQKRHAAKGKCVRADAIVGDINAQLRELDRSLSGGDHSEAFALCCKDLSRLLREGEERRAFEEERDPALTRKAIASLRELRVAFDCAGVYGKDRKCVIITGIDPIASAAQSKKITKALSASLGAEFSSPVFSSSGTLEMMTLFARPALCCESDTLCLAKFGEEVCGDTANVFEDDGNFYSMISDGTGSGKDAAISSRICCSFAEKLTKCGGSLPCVIGAINDFILTQSFECGATADLFRLDLYTREARFIKSGTPPTFVIRGDNIFKIGSSSMPIGLTHEINAEEIVMRLQAGDTVIMASDGVFCDQGAALKAAQAALDQNDLSCAELTKVIADTADTSSMKDDMSVLVVRVKAA